MKKKSGRTKGFQCLEAKNAYGLTNSVIKANDINRYYPDASRQKNDNFFVEQLAEPNSCSANKYRKFSADCVIQIMQYRLPETIAGHNKTNSSDNNNERVRSLPNFH